MTGEAVSGTRYEVRCADGANRSRTNPADKESALRWVAVFDAELGCGPHRVWSVDPDGTQTDITDESEQT